LNFIEAQMQRTYASHPLSDSAIDIRQQIDGCGSKTASRRFIH